MNPRRRRHARARRRARFWAPILAKRRADFSWFMNTYYDAMLADHPENEAVIEKARANVLRVIRET